MFSPGQTEPTSPSDGQVSVQPLTAVHGKITAISGASLPGEVTIISSYGKTVTIQVSADTRIHRNTQPATLSDLRESDMAAAAYDCNSHAAALEVYTLPFLRLSPRTC